ncbi:MAG: hypothetical protein FJ217_02650 [Ignavibacteria bacterium]|nr:hypothetical protein [Ignavibacteria bacterium]
MKRIMNAALGVALVLALSAFFTNEAAAQSKGTEKGKRGAMFIDKDGDGICDNFPARAAQNQGQRFGMKGKRFGPGDGTGNKGIGPKDGTGYGPGSGTGTGVCDGTGPKGNGGGRR